MTLAVTRTALLAAMLVAARAAAQQIDPRLERLDAATRPIVATLVDSARGAALPTEPLVQRALEGATKRAAGEVIVAAVRRLAVDLGHARDALGSTTSPAELIAGAAAQPAQPGVAAQFHQVGAEEAVRALCDLVEISLRVVGQRHFARMDAAQAVEQFFIE